MSEPAARVTAPGVVTRYAWWARDLDEGWVADQPGWFRLYILSVVIAVGVLSLPIVTRFTGVEALAMLAIGCGHVAWTATAAYLLRPRLELHPRGLDVLIVLDVVVTVGLAVSIPVLGGDPKTPLWIVVCLCAVFSASLTNMRPSVALLLVPVVASLVTIPWFLVRGADRGWSIAGPVISAGLAAMAYNLVTFRIANWRDRTRVLERDRTTLQHRIAELERTHLARDLHDAVGSTLTLASLYSELIERHASEPKMLRQIARDLRDEANHGLGDLRGLLDALAPEVGDLSTLSTTLRTIARRTAAAAAAVVEVELDGDGHIPVESHVRLAVVRVVQEALHNAVRHGAAERILIKVGSGARAIRIEVTDSGIGFDLATAPVRRGLKGLRARVDELGGHIALDTAPGRGTRIDVTLPIAMAKADAD